MLRRIYECVISTTTNENENNWARNENNDKMDFPRVFRFRFLFSIQFFLVIYDNQNFEFEKFSVWMLWKWGIKAEWSMAFYFDLENSNGIFSFVGVNAIVHGFN